MNIIRNNEELKKISTELNISFPYSDDTSVLNSNLKIRGKEIPNRICYQAMEGCDSNPDGTPSELTLRRYRRFASGGPGIIWYEATAVREEGKANPSQSLINKENIGAFKKTVDEIKEICNNKNGYKPVIILQLTHSGRYSKPQGIPAPLIAYNNPVLEGDKPISSERILSDDYLDGLVEDFVRCAKLAKEAGFDGIDIKSCHRYLMCELLSAYERKGKYGGSFENRTRLHKKIVTEIRKATGEDFIVSARLNIYDGIKYPYGFGMNKNGSLDSDFEEPCRLVSELHSAGLDMVDITMGNPYFNPHVNRPYAKGGYDAPEHPLEGVKRLLDGAAVIKNSAPEIPVICSGLSFLGGEAANVAAAYIKENKFDFAGYGRQIFAYPEIASKVLSGIKPEWKELCFACSKCTEIMRCPGGTPGCALHDEVYREIYRKTVMK